MSHGRPQRTGGGTRYLDPLPTRIALLALALALVIGGDVRPAGAFHYVDEPGGSGCSSCHTLSSTYGEPNTDLIKSNTRTLAAMKSAYNPTTPAPPPEFGCTYCHNNPSNAKMRGVLNHFTGRTSMHPVGKNFVSNANTDNEYLSTWLSATANELDCVDCHDVGLGEPAVGPPAYPEHGIPPVTNPFMLRNVSVAGQYDDLCRSCHGNAAPYIKGAADADHLFRLTAASAHTDGTVSGSGVIAESDGTLLRPSAAAGNDKCRTCHDTHYSANFKLFNDGHESAESNIDVATDCTTVCHYNGDQYDNFETHGHGLNTSSKGNALNFNCTNCHTVNARHDSPFTDTRAAKMFAATPDPLFSSLTPTKSLTSICYTCHGTLKAHRGTVGCLDCHDEHAEGSGTAGNSNIFMVPQQLPNRISGATEASVFEHAAGADFDYYMTDSTPPHIVDGGLCDNGVCHAGKTVGSPAVPITPLSGLMAGSNHTGGNKAPLIDCSNAGGCHTHNSTSGSWSAAGSCTKCHGQPPTSANQSECYIDHFENFTPHAKHANPTTAGGYQFDCQMCHNNYNDDKTHDDGSYDADDNPVCGTSFTYESVWFDKTFNPAAALFPGNPPTDKPPPYTQSDMPDYDVATNTCSNIYCHSNGSSKNAVGSVQWMAGLTTPNYSVIDLPCTSCHNDGGAPLKSYPADAAGNHARHVSKGVGCQNCHSLTTSDGTSILLGNSKHVNQVKDVVGGGTYNTQAVSFTWAADGPDGISGNADDKTCSNLSCHNGRQFTADSIKWTTAYVGGWCTNCHNNGTNNGVLTNAWPVQGKHQLHAGATPINYAYECYRCHPDNGGVPGHSLLDKTVTVDFALNFVAGGTYYPNGYPPSAAGGGDDSTCDATYCHGSNVSPTSFIPDWDDTPSIQRRKDDGSFTAAVGCDMCHGTAGLTTGRPNSPATGGRHTGTTHATLVCTTCHLNTNTDHTLHAKGPAQPVPPGPVRADAAMAALMDPPLATSTYTRAIAASLDQGFSYTNGTCGDMTTGCHPAANWGQSFDCALCHGDRVAGTYWPDGTNTAGHYYDSDKGSHPEHIAAIQTKDGFTLSQADQTAMCAYCHPGPGSANHRTDTVGSLPNRVDVINDGVAANVGTFGRIDNVVDKIESLDTHTLATYNNVTLVCANADCHYEKVTPAYGPVAGTVGWEGGDTATPNCETCHYTRGLVGVTNYPTVGRNYVVGTAPTFADGDLPDSHLAHVAGITGINANASKSYPCSYCHAVLADTAHLNGTLDLTVAGNPTINKDLNPADELITPTTSTVKYGIAANTVCANMYCHGADFVVQTQGTNVTPVWNDQTTGTCGRCHDVDTSVVSSPTQPLTQGAHGTHMAGLSGTAWGPNFGTHYNDCSVCHGFKPLGSACTPCHGPLATVMPGNPQDAGFAWEPSASHVEGNFQVDFENQNRGWNTATGAGSGLLTTLNGTAVPATLATDICDRCHSTWDPDAGGAQLAGAVLAKQNWAAATRITNCLLCHNATAPASSTAVNAGVPAPPKDTFYTANGHGLPTTSTFGPATLHNQNGPEYACSVCHAENSAHVTGALGEDRLDAANVDALDYTTTKSQFCLDCHGATAPGMLGANAVAKASVHSGGVTGRYAPAAIAGNAYGNSASWVANPGYQCDACHDPHGTGKLAMIKATIDGNLGGVSNPVPITNFLSAELDLTNLDPAAGTGGGQTGVCDACHVAGANPPHPDSTTHSGNHNQGGSGDSCMVCHDHTKSFVGSCTRCHGNSVAGSAWPDSGAEHGSAYPNRAGDHQQHIDAIYLRNAAVLAGATPTEKKNKTCDWCHPNAGAGGHEVNTVGSLASTADIHGDPQNSTTSFRNIMGVANSLTTDSYDNTVAVFGKDCSNVDCHYRVTTPTTGTATPDGDGWYQPLAAATCANCHGDGNAGLVLPNMHSPKHVATSPAGKGYGCWYCHPTGGSGNPGYAMYHENGSVDWSFVDTFDPGARTELYNGLPSGTTTVKYGIGVVSTCASFYCHGNFTNGTTLNTPDWGVATTGQCGTCHNGDGTGNLTVIATGNHTDHLTDAKGPLFGNLNCAGALTGCHTAGTLATTTHVDGSVQFDNIAVAPAASTLGLTAVTVPTATDTDRCTYCHATATVNATVGTVLAKANWATGAYTLPCLNCHAGAGAATMVADGTGMSAPNQLGDDVNYGAEVKGHNRPAAAGPYLDMDGLTTNVAANKNCADCHDTTLTHFNGVNDTTYAGQRLLATINGVATGSTVTGACNACHSTGGTTPATSLVSTHGNQNAAFVAPPHDAAAEAFAYKCEACHTPHGMTNGTGYNNIYMIKTAIGVGNSFTATPGGADVTTIPAIRVERMSGTNSLDDGLTTADNVCLTCHTNANRPGSGTALRTAGGDHTGNAGGYTGADTGKNCASCHTHSYDAVYAGTADGFMPQPCDACHSYPGLAGPSDHPLSGVHNMHVNATTGYSYACTTCHFGYNHNQSNYFKGGTWNDANVPVANINVRFDTARNPGGDLMYGGAEADSAAAPGVAGTHNGTCANLYCHGDNTTSQTDWTGTGSPVWGTADPVRLACTGCHADVPATGAHPLHVVNNQATDRTDCNLCHVNVQLIDAASPIVATHVDGTTAVLPAMGYAGATGPLFSDGYCTGACHASAAFPGDGYWTDAALNCDACHYYNVAGNPSAVTNTTGTTYRPISETSHDGHFAATGRTWACNDCHTDNGADTSPLAHVTSGAGNDAAWLTGRAVPTQSEATISTTTVAQWWNAPADWTGNVTKTCANRCHYPSAVGGYVSTAWGTANAGCSFCHATASPGPATGSHAAHMTATATYGLTVACTSCHPNNGVDNGHMTGVSELVNMTALTYSAALTPPWNATLGTCTTSTCHQDGAGTAVVTSIWGTPIAEPSCSICHAQTPVTGNHTAHLSAAYGPGFGTNCGACHVANPNNTSMNLRPKHINGTVEFANVVTSTSADAVLGSNAPSGAGLPDATSTDRCNHCHSTTAVTVNVSGPGTVNGVGTVLAKTNWGTGTYELPCLSCHNGTDAATQNADGSGIAAPDELGNDSTYGAEIRGHNRSLAAGNYTDAAAVVTNPPAAKLCDACHDKTATHINGVNDLTYAGQRLLATINGVVTGSTVTGACYACHGTASGTPASSQVSTHGNTNGAFVAPQHDAAAEAFAYKCEACHNVHGNTNGTGYVNIYMIKPTIGVGNSFTATPGGADATTIANIRFERVSGVDSLDDGATTADNVCYTCHTNANRPGSGTALRTAGGNHTGNTGGYTGVDTSKNCAACHMHNYDGIAAGTADGFMPQGCDACHSYPGLAGPSDHALSGVHTMHVDTTTGYAFACTTCHFGYNHNQSNFFKGGTWNDTNVPVTNINVQFDPARNAGTNLTYGGAEADSAAAPGITGTHNGTCANLYCHGDNTTSQTDWTGTGSPVWGIADPVRLACTGCHADVPATGAHTLHANSTGALDRSDCNLCHTNVGLIDAVSPTVMTHADGTTNVLLTWTGATGPLFVNGYCSANTCHSSGATDGLWNDPVLNCDACHYFNTAGNPVSGNNTTGTTFRQISKSSHDGHFDATGKTWSCNDCHPNNTTDTAGQASLTIGLAHLTVGAGTDAVILQNKAVPVQDNAAIDTTVVAQWWNAPADWTDGTNVCANRCHYPSAVGGYISTAWGTTSASCTFCHATASPGPATGSHAVHMNAAGTFGINTIACTSCHPDWATGSNYGHMSGSVNFANMAALAYSGTVAIPYGAPFGTCTTTTCHANGKGAAVASPTWGAVSADCTICHLAPNTAVQTGNEGARHVKHDGHVWAPNICGTCHAAPNNKTSMATYATHINGVVNMGGTATVAYLGGGDCTNACHDVIPASAGDWLDAVALACTDCHSAGFIGTAPTSGLHGPMTNVMAHDVQFKLTPAEALPGTATCTSCHTASGPSTTHLTGPNGAAPESWSANYSFVAANLVAYVPATGCQATCHMDYKLSDAGGLWRRKWLGVSDALPGIANIPGDAVCGNCHGDFTNGWRWNEANASTTSHTNPYAGNTGDAMGAANKHPDCAYCHGWGAAGANANYNIAWGTAPGHGDGSITMNGPDNPPGPAAGAQYDDATGGCAAACHAVTFTLNTTSGWDVNYGDFGSGACEMCHNLVTPGRNGSGAFAPNVMGAGNLPAGNGTTPKPFDDGTWGYNVNGHGANGTAAVKTDTDFGPGVSILAPDLACSACHALQSHHYDGVLDGGAAGGAGTRYLNTYHLRTDLTYPYINAADADTQQVQLRFDDACFRNCHEGKGMARGTHGSNPAAGVVQFGRIANVISDGEPLTWPVDSDITTRAGTAGTDYAPCSTCHSAHGTNTVESTLTSNRMLRVKFYSTNELCNTCHY